MACATTLMAEALFPVLFENRDLLLIDKPAGLVCHPTKNGPTSSLIGRIKLYLGEEAEAHMINRLDRETSGLVLVAKQKEGAGFLRKLWEKRLVRKTYFAIVHGHPLESSFDVDAPLGKDEESEIVVKDCVRMDGADSVTSFVVLDRFCHQEAPFSLLKVFPRTGRKHQIRIHLSHAGYPIVGDKIYGIVPDAYLSVCFGELSAEQAHQLIFDNHALHASGLSLSLADDSVEMQAPINPKMLDFCVKGGVSADLFPLEPMVEATFEDRFIEAVCNHLDAVQRAKRSN